MEDIQKKVLFISSVFPEPDSSAAGSRLIQLIRFFQSQGYKVLFASTGEKSPFSYPLEELSVPSFRIRANDPQVDIWLKELDPQMVVFDRFFIEEQFGWRVSENCPEALTVLDTEDLHFLRKRRELALKGKLTDQSSLPDQYRELAAIYRSDISLIISSYEFNYLEKNFPLISERIFYLPFLYEQQAEKLPGFEERCDMLFIGNFLHPPNLDAVRYLKSEIWPLIRKQYQDLKIHIYGAYLPASIRQLHAPQDGFMICGRAESAFEVLERARILLAPLRFGAGLKGKIMEAMICGTPFVTTSIGAEGIVSDETSLFVSDDPVQIAREAVELYTDKTRWKEAQENGFDMMDRHFSKNKFEKLLQKKMQELFTDGLEMRGNNLIGNMLKHHTTSSAKFMSKWIEEKNKK